MTKVLFSVLAHFILQFSFAQQKQAEDFGFRHIQTNFKGDRVDILLKIKKGDEQKRKSLFLFCQGSLPQPLIKYEGENVFSVFPFQTDSLEMDFHLAIISKPYIPVIIEAKDLGDNFMYKDPITGNVPVAYTTRNLLDYYVSRNLKVLNFLEKLPFVDNKIIVVAGHSEGSTIAAKLAVKSKKVTHLIYTSGNPLGRIMSMIGQARERELSTGTISYAEAEFDYWEQVVRKKNDLDDSKGDTFKATYDFSIPPIKYLEQLSIPVLVSYGTKDNGALCNDFLRVELMRQGRKNFTFKSYIGLEHNFFPVNINGQPDYSKFNWDAVAYDWWRWIMK